jgi:hypothetical protein
VQYQKEPKKLPLFFLYKKFTPLASIKRLEKLDIYKRNVKSVFTRQNKGRLSNSSNLSDYRLTVSTPAMIKQVRGRIQQKHQLSINLVAQQLITSESSIIKED